MTMKSSRRLSGSALAAIVAIAAISTSAKPRFFMPETLYAAPGVECSVFFAKMFESVWYSNYAFKVLSTHWKNRCLFSLMHSKHPLRLPSAIFHSFSGSEIHFRMSSRIRRDSATLH